MKKIFKDFYLAGMPGFLLAFRPWLLVLLSRQRDTSLYDQVDFTALMFIFYSLFSFGISWKEFHSQHKHFYYRLFFQSSLLIFIAFSVLALFSTIWSVNVPLTGYRSFECFSMIFLIAAVVVKLTREQGIERMMEWIVKWYVAGEIFAKLIVYSIRDIEIWPVLWSTSQMTSTVFFYLAIYHIKSKIPKYITLFFAIISASTTAYVGMSFGLMGMWFAPRRKKLIAVFGLIILGFAIAIFGMHNVLKHTIFFQKEGIGMEYTNGRDKLWTIALEAADERPWKGYGFFAGEAYKLYGIYHSGVINAHSSFCSSLMGLGYMGTILIIWYILSYARLLYGKHLPQKYKLSLASCYVVAVCHCMANPGIGSRVFGSWMAVMILFIMINVIELDTREKREIEEAKQKQETWQNRFAVFRR